MTTRFARRIARTARTARVTGLVAVAAAAALSLTACQSAGNGAATGAEKGTSGSSSRSVGDGGASNGAKSGTYASQAGVRTATSVARRTSASAATTKAASPARIQTLVDGSTARIYQLGDQHYRVEIVSRGSVLATLETKGQDAGLDANDMFVVLTLGGEVHSWMGGGHTGPGTFKLAGGWTAKVTKIGELRYRAQILGHEDAVYATLNTNEHDVGLDANGVYIVLSAGGVISSHM